MKPVKRDNYIAEIKRDGYQKGNSKPGSHEIWIGPTGTKLSIPMTREISPGTLRNIENVRNSNKR